MTRMLLGLLIAALPGTAPGCDKVQSPERPPARAVAAPQAEEIPRRVLHSRLAGSWYEGDPERLRAQIQGMLDEVPGPPLEGVCALILPHAGYRWSGPTAAYGVRQVLGRSFDRVVVIGPSHRVGMENMASAPSFTHYATPLGEVPLDTEFLAALRKHPCFGDLPHAHEQEHSVQIEIPFLQVALGSFRLAPVVVGRLDAETARAMGQILAGMIDGRTLVVASSDFTHYGPNYDHVPFKDDVEANLRKLDLGAFEAIRTGNAEEFYAYVARSGPTICGRQAIRVLLEMRPADAEYRLLKYDTSGRAGGDFSNSVSYLSVAVLGSWPKGTPEEPGAPEPLGEKDRDLLLKLARRTLEHRLQKGRAAPPEELGIEVTGAMRRPGSAFVTLKKEGRLRGCIGGIYPVQPLYREVMARAIDAALEDSRFPPVGAEELAAIHIEISALTPPRPVASHKEIVLGRHGIIMRKGGRGAVFLPQVPGEQGWDLEQTLRHLSEKMKLVPEAWEEDASFLVFEAEVFGEPEGKSHPRE